MRWLEHRCRSEPGFQNRYAVRVRQVMGMSRTGMIGMAVGDDSIGRRPDRIDVKIARRAVKPGFADLQQRLIVHGRFPCAGLFRKYKSPAEVGKSDGWII